MTDTLERFADLGLTTDGGLGEVVPPSRTPAGGTGGTSRRGGEKAKRVSPNPWAIGGNKETPDFRMLLLGP